MSPMRKQKLERNEEQEAQVYALLREYDKPYRHGRFAGVQADDVVNCSRLYMYGRAACLYRRAHGTMRVKDFTGVERVAIQRGDMIVRAVGYEPGGRDTAVDQVRGLSTFLSHSPGRFWAWTYTEDVDLSVRMRSLGLHPAALSISASSEYRTLWTDSLEIADAARLNPFDEVGLRALNIPKLRVDDLAKAIADVESVVKGGIWTDHYSHYNKRRSWSACALRGFGGVMHRVEKPSEMSKLWKSENPQRLNEPCIDTRLRALLPEVEPILAALGDGPVQRIRLMRLSKGEGELSRHADITDREAGTADGKILRFHVPIVTNARVLFKSWGVNGSSFETHFEEGRAFYLDTRKAHTAVNHGPTDRIHLVVDCIANAKRRGLLL